MGFELKEAVVTSFHSQVPFSLSKIDYYPEAIVSFDAHLDVYFGTKEILDLIPKDLRLAALRASSHTMLRRTFGELPLLLKADGVSAELIPEMFLVTPEISLDTHIFEMIESLQVAFASGSLPIEQFENPKEWFPDSLSKIWGIKLFISPPKRLLDLINCLREVDFLLDLDIDYLYEMQNECYTPLKKAKPSDLGKTEQILKFVRKTKPSVITISEPKVSTIRNSSSNFSMFVKRLKNLGYAIKHNKIFPNDEYAISLIKAYEDFYQNVQKPLFKKHFAGKDFSNSNAHEQLHKELVNVAKNYFQSVRRQLKQC